MTTKNIGGILFQWVIPLAILSVAAMSVMLLGKKTKANRKKPPPRIAVPVDVVRAEPYDGHLQLSATGLAVPFREVELSAEVEGRIVWKSDALLPGRYVQRGDELVRIDPADYELEVARLEQQLAKADADLQIARVEKENADRLIALATQTLDLRKRERDRMKTLKNSFATSDSEADAVEKLFLDSQQELTTQENVARALQAKADGLEVTKRLAAIGLDRAKLDLARTTIRAPFSGVVIDHAVEANGHVQPGDKIAAIEDTSRVEVRCNLRKEDLDFLPTHSMVSPDEQHPGVHVSPANAYQLPPLKATIRHERAGQTYFWTGTLSRQDGLGMDERTRTMPVRVLIRDPLACRVEPAGAGAKPIPLVRGMFVHVELQCKTDRPLLVIPEETIRPGKTIWLMDEGKLRIRNVHIARIDDGVVYVDPRTDGLTPQHSIIRSPVPSAKEGLAVTANSGRRGGKGGRGGRGGRNPDEPLADGPRSAGQRAGGPRIDGPRVDGQRSMESQVNGLTARSGPAVRRGLVNRPGLPKQPGADAHSGEVVGATRADESQASDGQVLPEPIAQPRGASRGGMRERQLRDAAAGLEGHALLDSNRNRNARTAGRPAVGTRRDGSPGSSSSITNDGRHIDQRPKGGDNATDRTPEFGGGR